MDWPLSLLVDIAQERVCWVLLIAVILLVVLRAYLENQRARREREEFKDYENRLAQIGLAGGLDKTPGKSKPKWKYSGLFRGRLLSMTIVQRMEGSLGNGDYDGGPPLHQVIVTLMIGNPDGCNLTVVRRKGFFDRRKGNRLSFAGWPDDFLHRATALIAGTESHLFPGISFKSIQLLGAELVFEWVAGYLDPAEFPLLIDTLNLQCDLADLIEGTESGNSVSEFSTV